MTDDASKTGLDRKLNLDGRAARGAQLDGKLQVLRSTAARGREGGRQLGRGRPHLLGEGPWQIPYLRMSESRNSTARIDLHARRPTC